MVSHPETGSDSPIGSDRDRGRDSGYLFWKKKRKKEKWVGGWGIVVNPTGTKVVCFSRFLLRLSLPLMFAASF